MADRVRKVNYCYVKVPNRAGQGEALLGALREANVNLLAFSGFPVKAGTSQLDMVAEKVGPVNRVAKKLGMRVSKPKKGFLIQGNDEVGAVHKHIRKLTDQKINVTAADAVCAGKGRYGMILWVKPGHYARAARALNAK
jgi:hypothetical protein